MKVAQVDKGTGLAYGHTAGCAHLGPQTLLYQGTGMPMPLGMVPRACHSPGIIKSLSYPRNCNTDLLPFKSFCEAEGFHTGLVEY